MFILAREFNTIFSSSSIPNYFRNVQAFEPSQFHQYKQQPVIMQTGILNEPGQALLTARDLMKTQGTALKLSVNGAITVELQDKRVYQWFLHENGPTQGILELVSAGKFLKDHQQSLNASFSEDAELLKNIHNGLTVLYKPEKLQNKTPAYHQVMPPQAVPAQKISQGNYPGMGSYVSQQPASYWGQQPKEMHHVGQMQQQAAPWAATPNFSSYGPGQALPPRVQPHQAHVGEQKVEKF